MPLPIADIATEFNQYVGICVGLVTILAVVFGAGFNYAMLRTIKTTLSNHINDDNRRFDQIDRRERRWESWRRRLEVGLARSGVRIKSETNEQPEGDAA